MKYDIIFSDFDGTLLRTDDTVADETVAAIARYRAAGGKFVITTGRMLPSILPWARKFGLEGEVIACQGAVIADIATGEHHFVSGIEHGLAREILADLEADGQHIHLYHDDTMFVNVCDEFTRRYEAATGVKAVFLPGGATGHMRDYRGALEKILCLCPPERTPGYIAKYAEKYRGRLVVNSSAPFILEIVSATCTKGTGVRWVAERCGVPLARTLAMGDSTNDVELLKAAGWGVAVANAADALKAVADEVTVSCDEDAVGKIIQKYGV